MADRSTLFQRIQIGVEGTATPGTAATATRELAALSVEPSVQVEIDAFRPMGKKFSTVTALGKEWSEASLSGRATYTEIVYPLASVVSRINPVVGTALTNGTAYVWSFSPRSSVADNPATYTIEQGDTTVRAHRMTYGTVTELGISFSRDAIELSGAMIARQLEDGITLSGGGTTATQVALVPVLPTDVSVYIGTSPTHLNSATALTRALSAEWKLGDRFGPIWTLDARENSWAGLVETEPNLEVSLTVEADAAGMALLPLARSGETRFLRVEALGGSVPGTNLRYRLTVDTAFKVSDVGEFSDEDGLYALEYTLKGVSDSTYWGGTATVVTVVNEISAL
jgi:hypothetical protein